MKFLCRTAHVVSILVLFVVVAHAQTERSPQPRNRPNNEADVTRQENERNFRMLADELRAIREQAAQADRDRTAKEQEEAALRRRSTLDTWVYGDEAPVWSNWILAGIALIAGITAVRAFNHQRDAVRLTERADMLFETVRFLDPATNEYTQDVHPRTLMVMVQKNFGRTTATDVRVRWRFFMDGDPIPETDFLPPAVVGAEAQLETRILPDIGTITGVRYIEVGRGSATLRAIGELTYTDVFKNGHHAIFRGTFRPVAPALGAGAFAIDTEERD